MPDIIQTKSGQTLNLQRGDQFLVRYPSTGLTVWLYDKTRNINIPFPSEQVFQLVTGKTVQEAAANGDIYDLTDIIPNSTLIPDAKGFDSSGKLKDPVYINSTGNTATTSSNPTYSYGKQRYAADKETLAMDYLGQALTTMKRQGGITQATFDKIAGNAENLASYLKAWLYGGYTMDDIYRDIKAQEYGISAKAIDPTKTADEYYKTGEYAAAKSNASLNAPANLWNIDPVLFNNPVFKIPNAAFTTLVPVLDINSASFKEEASKIKDAYYDLLLQQLDATTTQQKTLADDNWRIFKENISKRYGIQLSDNAMASWKQIQNLGVNYAGAHLADSGIYNEVLDRYLAERRLTDERLRENRTTEEDTKRREYYITQASPEQIKNDLTDDERQRWGLKPTQTTLDFINNLKTTYPDLTDAQINDMRNVFVDENGNLRSTLYQQLVQNRYEKSKEKQAVQEQTLEKQKLSEEEKAYAQYTKSENPFLRTEDSTNLPTNETTPTTPDTSFATNIAWNQQQQQTQQQQQQNTTYTPSVDATGMQDVSNRYGLYKNTVYDKSTGQAFSTPEIFFTASGITNKDWSKIKLDTGYTPPAGLEPSQPAYQPSSSLSSVSQPSQPTYTPPSQPQSIYTPPTSTPTPTIPNYDFSLFVQKGTEPTVYGVTQTGKFVAFPSAEKYYEATKKKYGQADTSFKYVQKRGNELNIPSYDIYGQ